MKIIGGPFYDVCVSKSENIISEAGLIYFESGTDAFEAILLAVEKEKEIKTACVPAYYCSVITDVLKNKNIEIYYYDVFYSEGKIDFKINHDVKYDIVVIFEYYGFINERWNQEINYLKKTGAVLIEDKTHNLLTDENLNSDYWFASVRKWTGVKTVGIAYSNTGNELSLPLAYDADNNTDTNVDYNINNNTNKEFADIWNSFIDSYKDYMNSGIGERRYFGDKFWDCECALRRWKGCSIDEEDAHLVKHWDIEKVRNLRRRNADILLNNIDEKLLVYKCMKKEEVPFFVPINVSQREELCEYLDGLGIYCSMLWDRPEGYDTSYKNEIFENDFGIICDERYSAEQMMYIADNINFFMGKKN